MLKQTLPAMAILLWFADWSEAQTTRPSPELRFRIGASWFLDEDIPANLTIGGSFRAYLTRRLSVEPEFLHIRGTGVNTERSYIFLPNVAYDLAGQERRTVPYVIGGLGLYRMVTPLPGGGFTQNDLGFLGGTGARVALTRRFYFFPELRIGIEPNFYLSLTAGFGLPLVPR